VSFTWYMWSGLTNSRGFGLARKCGHRLVCIAWKTLPCFTGFTTLNDDGLYLAERMSSHSHGTSTTSFLCTPICLKSPSHGKYECPLTGKTCVTTFTILNIWTKAYARWSITRFLFWPGQPSENSHSSDVSLVRLFLR
jgi:hypothetical protein